MSKDIIALGNAITDIFIQVTDQEIEDLGLKKGFVNEREDFYAHPKHLEIINREQDSTPGGSETNTVYDTALLGLKSGIIGTIGKDDIGKAYKRDVRRNGIEDFLTTAKGESGICYILVTPDKEKTQIPHLKVSKDLRINHDDFKDYQIFHISGHQITSNTEKALYAISKAKKQGLKISFDMADPLVPKEKRKELDQALEMTDYLTVTEHELRAYTDNDKSSGKDNEEKDLETSIKKIQGMCEIIAVKKGAQGSEILNKKEHYHIETCPVIVKNTTGAGDAYTAGLLYGILKGFSPEECGRTASYIAAQVCAQEGARLKK